MQDALANPFNNWVPRMEEKTLAITSVPKRKIMRRKYKFHNESGAFILSLVIYVLPILVCSFFDDKTSYTRI